MANGGKQLSDFNPSGTVLGQSSTDATGFFGQTPVVRFATSIPIPTTTATVSISASQYGFSTSTQAQDVINAVNRLVIALGTTSGVGLISNS